MLNIKKKIQLTFLQSKIQRNHHHRPSTSYTLDVSYRIHRLQLFENQFHDTGHAPDHTHQNHIHQIYAKTEQIVIVGLVTAG